MPGFLIYHSMYDQTTLRVGSFVPNREMTMCPAGLNLKVVFGASLSLSDRPVHLHWNKATAQIGLILNINPSDDVISRCALLARTRRAHFPAT